MGYGDRVASIEKLANGYTVEVCDEEARENNKKPKTEYQDPWKSYAFSTAEEVIAFMTAHLDKLKPPPDANEEFSSAFNAATKDD